MRRVVHLTGANQGGAERQLLALMQESVKREDPRYRHEVVIVRPGPLSEAFASTVPTTVLHKRGGADLSFARDLRRVLAQQRPDVLHTWAPTPNLWGPIVARSLPASKRPGVVLAEVGLDEWKGTILKAADRAAYRCADRIVGCAQAVTEAAIRRGAARSKTATVFLGVRVPPRPERSPKAGRVQLLGRVDFRKGHHRLLDVWPAVREAVPQAELVMSGPAASTEEIELRDSIATRIAAEPVLAQSVTLTSLADPVAALAEAQVLAVPSSSEGLPNVILEAFSGRVPVVATAVGGIPELVHGQQGGWCVPLDDGTALRDALVTALRNTEEAQARADHGRAFVERLTLSRSLDAWEDQYDLLFGAGHRTTTDRSTIHV